MLLKLKNFLLSLFSGTLLALAWKWHLSIVILFAFVPLLMMENNLSASNAPKRKLKVFGLAYLNFLVWNILVTWWIVYASFGGAILAYVANALLMAIVFLIFSNIKNRIGKPWAVWLLIPIWLAWEYLHSLWDLAWIWLSMGNVFSFNHNWIQWYEFTGTSGGTLWALFVNILVFQTIKNNSTLTFFSKPILKIAAAIILPILFSYLILIVRKPLSDPKATYDVVVVQPNIDPYNEKFNSEYQPQFFKMLKLIEGKITPKTNYLVLPETFITGINWFGVNEDMLEQQEEITWFKDSLLRKFPDLKIIVGASSYTVYNDPKEATATSRKDQGGTYFDCFNTAFQIDRKGVQVYHKSKLVPGVEQMPFPALFKPLEKLALDMGGTSGSLGTQKKRVSFSGDNNVGIAPVICYESVFSDYVTEYIRAGATFIFIITNDGWWDDTPGYVHHLNYARLRAIENRRQIARSANTGVSCFIDEFGNITQATEYWKEAVIEKNIVSNPELTFFARFGDLISYASVVIAIFALLFSFFLKFKK